MQNPNRFRKKDQPLLALAAAVAAATVFLVDAQVIAKATGRMDVVVASELDVYRGLVLGVIDEMNDGGKKVDYNSVLEEVILDTSSWTEAHCFDRANGDKACRVSKGWGNIVNP